MNEGLERDFTQRTSKVGSVVSCEGSAKPTKTARDRGAMGCRSSKNKNEDPPEDEVDGIPEASDPRFGPDDSNGMVNFDEVLVPPSLSHSPYIPPLLARHPVAHGAPLQC